MTAVSRRGFFAATAGAGAAIAAARMPMANAQGFDTGSLGAVTDALQNIPTGSGMVAPQGPLGYVGVTFAENAEAAGRVRFGFPDGSLSDWFDLEQMDSAPDSGSIAASELVQAPEGSTSFEVDALPGALANVFDDGRGIAPERREYSVDQFIPGDIGAFLHQNFPQVDLGQFARPLHLNLPIISRRNWGVGGDVGGYRWTPRFHAPQAITIHHTAVHPGPDRAASVRAIYNYHANTLGWGDVGYHIMIDPEGRMYQGRGGTAAGNPIFERMSMAPTRPNIVTAGHVGNNNNGNIGISLLGDFTHRAPTAAAIRATIDVVRRLSSIVGINPRDGITYNNQAGGRNIRMPFVSGHRQWGGTACPGNAFFPQLQFIRDRAAEGWRPDPVGFDIPLPEFGS